MVGGTTTSEGGSGGGGDAFGRFYEGLFPQLARVAWLLTGDAGCSEDLAQEALARTQAAFGRLDAPGAYARTVLVNLCKRHRTRSARRAAIDQRAASGAAPEAFQAYELLDVVDALPYRQKVVIVLRFYEDLSEADIAATLGCRVGTVKSLGSRALARLRRVLEQ